jgi:hypothetical protein
MLLRSFTLIILAASGRIVNPAPLFHRLFAVKSGRDVAVNSEIVSDEKQFHAGRSHSRFDGRIRL